MAGTSNPTHTSTPTSPLLSIPREIRDDICAYLLSAGHLAIMRTSKQIHHEARECLYREGVCRLNFGPFEDGVRNRLFSEEWGSCQNFHFRMFFGTGTPRAMCPTFWQFELFDEMSRTDRKRNCLVNIEYEPDIPRAPIRTNLYSVGDLLGQMSHLTCFTTLVVMVAPKQVELRKDERYLSDFLAKGFGKNKWDVVRKKLEPDLGPAKLVGDTDGEDQRLVFHPRDFRGS